MFFRGPPCKRENQKENKNKAGKISKEGGEEGDKRRSGVTELGNIARRALEEEGSSRFNISCLIQDVMKH